MPQGFRQAYLPASSDFIEKGRLENLLVPAICVQRGNPKSIKNLADLGRPVLKTPIVKPETLAIEALAVEILGKIILTKGKAAG